ncbi:MAG: hypothetical protein ABIQ39_08980, partial [Ilumatobacteraceae bacterium]
MRSGAATRRHGFGRTLPATAYAAISVITVISVFAAIAAITVARADVPVLGAAASPASIGEPATASAPAVPGTSIQLTPIFPDPACVPPSGVPASAVQVVVVRASATYASVDLLENIDGMWTCVLRDL